MLWKNNFEANKKLLFNKTNRPESILIDKKFVKENNWNHSLNQ
jgi:hypothetical protein